MVGLIVGDRRLLHQIAAADRQTVQRRIGRAVLDQGVVLARIDVAVIVVRGDVLVVVGGGLRRMVEVAAGVGPEHGIFHRDLVDVAVDRGFDLLQAAVVPDDVVQLADLDEHHVLSVALQRRLIKGELQEGVLIVLAVPAGKAGAAAAVEFVEVERPAVDCPADLVGAVAGLGDRQGLRAG